MTARQKARVEESQTKSELEEIRNSLSFIDLSKEERPSRAISTGVIAFDLAMGGGIPEGRFTEIYGEWQSGKSLLMYQTIANCQRNHGLGILYDSERAFEKHWAKALGIDLDSLLYYTPESLEDAFTSMEKTIDFIRNETESFKDMPVLIVYDSLASSVAKEEYEKPFGKAEMGLRARVISSSLRRMTNQIADQRIALVFINQLRSKIGVIFGSSDDSTGGRAPKFHAGLRIEMKKGKKLKDLSGRVVGMTGELEVVKSKVGIPFKKVRFEVLFSKGIPSLSGLLDYLVNEGVISRPTTQQFEFGGQRFRRNQFAEFWSEHKDQLIETLKSGTIADTEVSEENTENEEE